MKFKEDYVNDKKYAPWVQHMVEDFTWHMKTLGKSDAEIRVMVESALKNNFTLHSWEAFGYGQS